MSFVADAVGSAVGWVGDAISDVASFVVDDILEPVIDTVGGVVKGMIDDPLTTLATMAAVATGQVWAIPIIQGASVAAKGGDFGDIALAVAASYVGGQAGAYVGEAAGSYIGSAVGEGVSAATREAITQATTQVVSGATRGALTAAITGNGNILDGALGGALSGAASAGLSYVGGELGFGGETMATEEFDAGDWSDTSSGLESSFSSVIEGFKELPQVAQDMITGGATAAVTQLVRNGEVDADAVAGVIATAGITTGLLKPTLAKSDLNTSQQAIATKVIGDVVQAAYSGTDGYAAYQASIGAVGTKALEAEFDAIFTQDNFNAVIESITANSEEVNNTAELMEERRLRVDVSAENANMIAADLNAQLDSYREDIDYYNETARFEDQDVAEELRTDIEAKVEGILALRASLDSAVADYEAVYATYEAAAGSYKSAADNLLVDQTTLDELTRPVNELASELISKEINPEFNAEEYREINNIPEDVNAYVHWLQTGRKNITNQADYDARLDTTVKNQVADIVMANLDTKINSVEDIEALYAAVKEGVGNDLSVLQTSEGMQSAQLAAKEHMDGIEARAPSEYVPTTIERDADVTDADIAKGNAVAVFEEEDGEVRVNFTKQVVGDEVFSSAVNKKVTSQYDAATKQTTFFDSVGENLTSAIEAVGEFIIPSASASESEIPPLTVTIRPPTFTLKEIQKAAPSIAIDTAAEFTLTEEDYAELDFVTRTFLDFSKSVAKAADTYGADNPEDAYAVKLAAGVALDSGGQLLNAFNGVVTFFNDAEDADARETNLGKVSQAMMDIAKATQPAEYNAAIEKFRGDVGRATGFGATADAIWNGFKEAPFEVLTEYVGKELLQEIPLIIAGGGAGLIAKGAAGAAGAATALAQKLGTATAWTTNAGLQVLETAGATAAETYAELYDEAIKMGVAPEQAAVTAQEGAILNGATAAVIEATLGRILDPSDVLAKKLAGANDTLFGTALTNIAARGAGIAGEGVSEGFEETASTYLKIGMLEEINPAITQKGGRYEDLAGTLTASGILGAVSGTGTVAGITAGDIVYNAIQGGTYTGADGVPEDAYTSSVPADPNNPFVANALTYFNPTLLNATNDAKSDDPEVRAAADTTIKEALGYDAFFEEDGTIADLTQAPDSLYKYDTALSVLNMGNDADYTSSQEVQDAYDEVADQTPYKPTNQQLLGFTGQQAEAGLSKRLADTVNRGYVGQIFEQEGYTPTPEEISAALEQAGDGVLGQEAGTELAAQYDPKSVTEQEVRDYYAGQGLSAPVSRADLDFLTGQYDEAGLAEKADARFPVVGFNSIAELIGKPAQQVTATDIDFVTDLIAQRTAMTDTVPYTRQELQYDVTGDNVVNLQDQNVLQDLLTSQQTGNVVGQGVVTNQNTAFASTGITGELERLRKQNQREQQQQNVQQMVTMMQPGAMSEVTTPDPANIEYVYDPFGDSIFATPEQERLFVAPYSSRGNTLGNRYNIAAATGGLVQDNTDEIMKILGVSK